MSFQAARLRACAARLPVRSGVAALALGVIVCAALALSAGPANAEGGFQRGFVLTGRKADSYIAPRSDEALLRMAEDGSSHAAIFTQWFMDSPTSSHIAADTLRSPSDAAVLHAIAFAQGAGMQVTLKPQIGISSGGWIGHAHPGDPDAFWADYRTMILHYADLAEQSGASMLVVGTEMVTLSSDAARWRPLIAEIRTHFHGQLTYAANYTEFEHVPFWDALDYIGIDAYFALADQSNPAPLVADLATAWSTRGYLGRIGALSQSTGRKVLFTEIGYRGTHTTAVHPNVWNIVDDTDTPAQAKAYQAFYQTVADRSWLAGVYWWEVNVDDWWVQDYSPLGKPAEDVMKTWNAGHQPTAGPVSATTGLPIDLDLSDVTRTPVTDPAQPALIDSPLPEAPEPAREQPSDSSPAAPAGPAAPATKRQRIHLRLRGRHLRGRVSPYDPECAGRVKLRLRRRAHGHWRRTHSPAAFSPNRHGRFARKVRHGRLRIRAIFRSGCGTVRSRPVRTRRAHHRR